jgi:hypothetical protein
MTQPQVIPGDSESDDRPSLPGADAPPGAAETGADRPDARGRDARAVAARLAWPAGFVIAGLLLFAAYVLMSRTQPVTADFASVAVMAQDMLHGNLLLHGWLTTDVTFYTTELPQYVVLEYFRGYGPDVVHVAAAMTYTLVLLLAALLAKGKATGREALARVLVAGGIMLAPQLGRGVNILLLSPDHFGTQVPLLLVWLLIDRIGQRWYVPVLTGLVLAAVQVGDRIVITVAVAPIVAVCGLRVYGAVIRRSEPLKSRWFELSLAAAAIVSIAAGSLAAHLITAHGGYTQMPLKNAFSDVQSMPWHAWLTLEGILGMYGADFFNQIIGVNAAFTVLHLAGVAVAAWALWLAVRRFFRQDLIVQVLTVAIVINLAAYTFSVLPGTFWATRQITALLPLGAVLAGRLAAGRIVQEKLAPAMAVVLLGYVLALGHGVTQPKLPAYGQGVANWLAAHHLRSGFAEYPQANPITLDSGGRVQMLTLAWQKNTPSPGTYQSKMSWYDPRQNNATFVVSATTPHGGQEAIYYQARAAFGPPAQTYHIRGFTIMTWPRNLLTELH